MKLELIEEWEIGATHPWFTIRNDGHYVDTFLSKEQAERKFDEIVKAYSNPIPENKVLKSAEL